MTQTQISCRKDHMVAEHQGENMTRRDNGDKLLAFRTQQTVQVQQQSLPWTHLLSLHWVKTNSTKFQILHETMRLFLICLS